MPQDAEVAGQFLPFSLLDSSDPEDLWSWLEDTSARIGADFVAIPHNANISIGRMFPLVTQSGDPVDARYGDQRMRWERVVEVTQIKGDSEAHPLLSLTDEFADYEPFSFVLTPDGGTPDPTEGDYQRWTPSFGQVFVTAKVESRVYDSSGVAPGLLFAPWSVYASSGVRSLSDEWGRRRL